MVGRGASPEASRGRSVAGRGVTALVLGVALGATGCTGDAAAGGWTTTVDTLSNGAILVRHTPPPDPPATWRLEPGLRIGALDGEGPEVFGRIQDLAVAADGRVVVLDGQAQEIRVFAPDGHHLATWGRQGSGPGEFQYAYGVVFGPDGLVRVPDLRNSRLSFVDLDSGVVRSHRYQPNVGAVVWSGVVDSAGRSWSLHYVFGAGADPMQSLRYVAYDARGHPGDTIPQPREVRPPANDDPSYWSVTLSGGRTMGLAVPFYASAQFVLSPALRVWSTPEGDPSYRLIRWHSGRDTALILTVDRAPPATDMAAADSMVRELEEQFGTSLDRSKVPALSPAIEAFFFDDDGRLWVRVGAPADDSLRTFDAFDPDDGAYLGTLVTGLRLESTPPPTIRGDTLWGVVRDEMDVQYVVQGRLVETHR